MSFRLSNDPAQSQDAVFRFLANSKTHGLSEPIVRVDTADAVVFLAGPDVYKVKRAVKFPFMDLSTLDLRRRACEAEMAVNRANAPSVYLGAPPITRKGHSLAIGGKGEIVEWVVHMRRFDENATLDRVAAQDGISDAIIDKLALAIHRSHAGAPLRDAAQLTRLRPTSSRTEPLSRSGPSLRPGDRPQTRRRLNARFRDRAADAPQARRGRVYPPMPWRSAPAQHRPHRGRADFVRRRGILR